MPGRDPENPRWEGKLGRQREKLGRDTVSAAASAGSAAGTALGGLGRGTPTLAGGEVPEGHPIMT